MKRSFFITLALYVGLFALVMQLHVPSFKAPKRAINISNITIKKEKKVCECKKCSCKKIPLPPPKKIEQKVVQKEFPKPKKTKKIEKTIIHKKVIKPKKRKIKRKITKKVRKKHYRPMKPTSKPKKVSTPQKAPIPKPKQTSIKPPNPLQKESTPQKVVQKSYAKIYKENYFDTLRQAIQKYRRYPRIARRTKKEGIVRIAFRLTSSGRLENLRIVESSGFKVLDRAAIKTIKKASKEFPKPAQTIDLIVPIEYKLR